MNRTEMTDEKLREISVCGCERISTGASGSVFRMDNQTVLRVYRQSDPAKIEQERRNAEKMQRVGIPTTVADEIVRVGDRYGALYRMKRADTLAHVLQGAESEAEVIRLTEHYVHIIKQFHAVELQDWECPCAKPDIHALIDMLDDIYAAEELEKMHRLVEWVPNRRTALHSNPHMGNVLVENGRPKLIDMAYIRSGHPIFDLGSLYVMHVLMAPRSESMIGISTEHSLQVSHLFLGQYFETCDPEKLKLYASQIGAMAMLRYAIWPAIDRQLSEMQKRHLTANVKQNLLPCIDVVIRTPVAF